MSGHSEAWNFFLLIKRVTGNDKQEKLKMGMKQKTVNEVTVRAGFKLGFVPIFHIPVPVLVPYYPFPVLVTSLSNIACVHICVSDLQ